MGENEEETIAHRMNVSREMKSVNSCNKSDYTSGSKKKKKKKAVN